MQRSLVKPIGDGWQSGWGAGRGSYKTVVAPGVGRIRLEGNLPLLLGGAGVTAPFKRRLPFPEPCAFHTPEPVIFGTIKYPRWCLCKGTAGYGPWTKGNPTTSS